VLTVAASGPVANFAWGTINNQAKSAAFGATLTARDTQGRTVTSFNGNVGVSGQGTGTTAGIILITEQTSGQNDYFEFENVGNATANTVGWFVVPNNGSGAGSGVSSIGTPFQMPATVAAGAVVAITENTAVTYPYTINWSSSTFGGSNPNGWCMLCDNTGAVRDFVAWGYSAAQITSINIPTVTVGANTYTNITVPTSQWTGNGATATGFTDYVHRRGGTTDNNSAADWTAGTDETNKGVHNAGLTVPFIPPPPTYTVTPSSVTFTNGVWSGSLTMNNVVNTVKLIANDGVGHTGESNTFNVEADVDADGMGDTWEAANGLVVGTNDATADKDGDGQSNRSEWLSGTLPSDPASTFKVSTTTASGTDITITWPAVAGRRYNVATTTALGGTWTVINAAALTTGSYTHIGGAGGAARFYRVEIVP
jgi:hypothetical protein